MATETADTDSMFTIPQHSSVDVVLPVSLNLDVGSSVSAVGQYVSEYSEGIIDLFFDELRNLPFEAHALNELLKFTRPETGVANVAQTVFTNIGATLANVSTPATWTGISDALDLLCLNHHSHQMILDTVKSTDGLMSCHNGAGPVSYTHLTLPTICSV